MRMWRKGPFRRASADFNPVSLKRIIRLLALVSLFILLLLARHTSTEPTILGRWSSRYAGLLAFQSTITIALALAGIPALISRLQRRSGWTGSQRKAWSLLIAGLLLLPALWLLLRKVFIPGPDPVFALLAGLILVSTVTVLTAVMWWSGATELTVSLSPYAPLLVLLLIVVQLLLSAFYTGQVPSFDLVDEINQIGHGLRQFALPERFVQLLPERNATTWFRFQGYWFFTGAWMSHFGAGIQQLRFLNLLVAWMGVPFIYLTARRLFGHVPALIAAVCGIVFPMHFVTTRADVWVATATAIALYCYVSARNPGASRAFWASFFCGLVALSAIDGHVFGAAFALMFCLLHLQMFLRILAGRACRQEKRIVTGFLAGLLVYALVLYSYHVLLPGIDPATVAEAIQANLETERGFGESSYGTGPTTGNLLKSLQFFLYKNPYVFVSSLLGLLVVLRLGRSIDKTSLIVATGAGMAIFLNLAHASKYYVVFWFPFLCLWTGVGLAKLFPFPARSEIRDWRIMSLGTLFLVLALVLLCTIQLVETAGVYREDYERTWILGEIGREIDRVLPREDVVVAGTRDIYLGMTWRLNYGASCSFTRDDPKYWPLDEPQAVIFTPGRDTRCPLLSDWLIDHDFRPARCFAGHDLGEGVSILYLPPDLMPQEVAVDCSPEVLGWLDV
ncbi:MAG: glycosyltransferase family 39 protein [Anaerolineaceae bacterium]|nr:glycosyltransferase family 39 protein [Anaerolineaceae bacterium]